MKMIATASFKYASRQLKPGDEFECEEPHVEPLRLIGKAKHITPKRRNGYKRRDMRAER